MTRKHTIQFLPIITTETTRKFMRRAGEEMGRHYTFRYDVLHIPITTRDGQFSYYKPVPLPGGQQL